MPNRKIEIYVEITEGWEPNFIVRKVFTLPDWIPVGWWVAKDASGDIFCYEHEPTVNHSRREWVAEGRFLDVTLLFDAHQIDLPDVCWGESKWQQVGKSEVKDY